ncbi:FAD-dependent monooxygenase [Streptomyces sp. NPDC019396]|uniref:FAD-dependent monooxygenase n=1 Tax=Streptomyces sp. NPDC019396 TaxID=3154687 RepID=UPI0033DC47F2
MHRHGLTPTVLERAPRPRPGGQAIDIRGVALDVMDRMGLLDRARELRTRMRGMSVLDGDGNEIHRSTEGAYSSGRFDSPDIEVLREDLVRLLAEQASDRAEFIYGDSISALHEHEHGRDAGIHVDFTNGPSRTFDLVVGADGLHSGVRRLVFGPEQDFIRHLGTYLSVFSADNFLDLDNWQVWLRDGDTGFGLMPVRDNSELRIAAGFRSEPLADQDTETLRQRVVAGLVPLPWEGPRLAKAAAQAPDFFCDAMAQIHMDRWSRGRTALIGDAAHCPSPLSGQGTSLALVGAYVLAGELGRTPGDHGTAFDRYEERMRPFVALNQALATENPEGPASEESMARAKNAITLDV